MVSRIGSIPVHCGHTTASDRVAAGASDGTAPVVWGRVTSVRTEHPRHPESPPSTTPHSTRIVGRGSLAHHAVDLRDAFVLDVRPVDGGLAWESVSMSRYRTGSLTSNRNWRPRGCYPARADGDCVSGRGRLPPRPVAAPPAVRTTGRCHRA
jgi:hypothetical protein